jgi:hypothetical protein
MRAMREVTQWTDSMLGNHIYLLDGDRAIAYQPWGTGQIQYFRTPIRLDLRGRKFVEVLPNPFKVPVTTARIVSVAGSRGATYDVNLDEQTCTCSGFRFRGKCKHVQQAIDNFDSLK